MASETQIGNLVIDLKIKTNALEKGLETARKKIQMLEEENKKIESSNKSLDASYLAMSATAVLALGKILGAIKGCVNEYNSYTQAMSSLQNVSEYTGQSMSEFSNIMNKFGAYMTKADLATTIKNFSLMGMSAQETEKMIEALTNSAIRNRNANYTVSEAVRVASEGYRQGLSTLSDSAGVTENLSVMLDNYAKSIGKTASQLTEAEKNQAYLNRTMYAAEPFASAMSDYMDTLAGKQGQYSQSLRETQVAYAEAIEPLLKKFEEFKTNIISNLGDIISLNESATAGITTFIVTLGTLTIAITAIKKAYDLYKSSTIAATISTQGFTAALASNPFGALAIAISLVVSALISYTTATKAQEEATARLNEKEQQYNNILLGRTGYTEDEISKAKERKSEIEQEIKILDQIIEKSNKLTYAQKWLSKDEVKNLKEEIKSLKDEYEDLSDKKVKTNEEARKSRNDLNKELIKYNKYLDEANTIENTAKAFDIDKIKNQQKEAAQLKVNTNELQRYLNTIKKSNKESTEYQNAVQAVAKAYPEASSAGGVLTDVLEGIIQAQQLQADEAWNASQTSIQGHIDNIQAAINDENIQKQVAANMGIAWDENFGNKLRTILALLQTIGNYSPTEVPNITPTVTPRKSYGGSSSYSNKRLDNYKKEIAHKKALDQLSLQQEISMYETALRSYAKTTDEKRELREKIYELNKELANKEKEMLEQQTEDYETYIQQQKNLRGSAYDVTQQTNDYNKIIQMHRNYLNQIMKDERLSLDERKQIYREELQTIRDYEQQKRDLRVEQIDNTVSQLTNAITKRLEEMQEKDKEFIDKQIEEVEKLKEIRINAINEEYDAKIEAIEKELEALDKAEQQKSRDEEDAEHEKKKKRLEDLIAFEHDTTTKANYQKELDKLLVEYQKTLDSRALEDKKEALNAQKDLLQEEQDNKVQVVEDEVEKQKEVYDKQLTDLEEYYNKQIDMAQETAESMLLNVETNQDKILNLLKSYGNAYEITGQTLGEKLAQGINEGLASKIENIIARIQNSIDAGIEAQIAKIASSVYKYEAGSNKPQTKTITITQQNYIEQNPEMPSETYRKLNNVSQKLAEEFAGM